MSETAGGFGHTDIAIVGDDGTPVASGVVGELRIRGVGVMAGYNKRERWETFDENGWYHTGDLVYRNEGDPRMFYIGRTSELIKSGGANVSPLEVEAVIADFPDVAQCIVVGIEDPVRGEQVCAVIVPAVADIDVASIATRTREQLSGYKVPTRWAIVTSDQIPILQSGKFNRRALRGLVVDGALTSVSA
jgi:acyl-CoA synthetase (AMP-forming)/AMP-acid ligase II